MTLPRWVGPGAVAFLAVWLVLLAGGRAGMLRDPGTFWHTATGEILLRDGFIRHDPFTFTFAGTWWVPYQWLGEVGMALAHRLAGFDAQLLGAVTILAAVFAWLAVRLLRTGLHPAAVAAVVGLAVAAAGSHFHVRPHLFTLAALAATAAVFTDVDAGKSPRRLLWLVPLFAVWANVHGGWLGGFATAVIAAGGWVAFRVVGLPSPVTGWRGAVGLGLLLAALALTALATPYGTDMPRVWALIMNDAVLRRIIREHHPLDPAEAYAWPILGVAALYLVVLAGVRLRDLRASWLLPLPWLLQTFERCRHAPLFVVAAVVAVAAMWPHTRWAARLAKSRPDFYQPDVPPPARPWWADVWLPTAAVVVALGLQAGGVAVPVVGAGWAQHHPRQWPVELLDVLKEHEPGPGAPNRLFNGYVDGGFVIHHAPGYKVFVDDRCEVFGGDWLLAFVVAQEAGTAEAVARWEAAYGRFDYALTRTGTGFDDYFRSAPGWTCVKRTGTAAFYRRG